MSQRQQYQDILLVLRLDLVVDLVPKYHQNRRNLHSLQTPGMTGRATRPPGHPPTRPTRPPAVTLTHSDEYLKKEGQVQMVGSLTCGEGHLRVGRVTRGWEKCFEAFVAQKMKWFCEIKMAKWRLAGSGFRVI